MLFPPTCWFMQHVKPKASWILTSVLTLLCKKNANLQMTFMEKCKMCYKGKKDSYWHCLKLVWSICSQSGCEVAFFSWLWHCCTVGAAPVGRVFFDTWVWQPTNGHDVSSLQQSYEGKIQKAWHVCQCCGTLRRYWIEGSKQEKLGEQQNSDPCWMKDGCISNFIW